MRDPDAASVCRVPTQPSRELVAVANPHPGRDYEVRCETPEFTCVCPMTGQPDFARVTITYVPGLSIVELKSLKLYLWSYRDEGAFHEDVTNRILDDLVECVSPRRMTVETDWLVRGGIHTTVTASTDAVDKGGT
jgi:7-cyano-7-deazaguanine reductase